ncbi:hypothetical protein HX823_00470 [Pseudomonas sp. P7759]|uniref:hypothetical protein n=1 Tax=Pseudomonas sp. P7759 TaxID=2738831 RepID=UPI0015A19F9E|nr:hypothetical protein [Pseudomonas sp. P7759]NWC72544.1 hypothetical protein [Pseudomonas sp. P7759]
MSHNFKPGDLALIVGTRKYPGNIGKTCELVELLKPSQISAWLDPEDGRPVSNASGFECWLVIGDGLISGIQNTRGACLALPSHLMPLRRDFSPVQQKAKEAV